MWLVLALAVPAAYAVACIFDGFLSSRSFRQPAALVFYASLFNLIFAPVAFFAYGGGWPDLRFWPALVGLGLTDVAYLYPYYRGLQSDETSTAISFFAIGRIFIPILAFFGVGEVLLPRQYLGILIIVASSIALSLKRTQARVIFSRSFWYIALAALILSGEGVLFKYLFDQGVSVGGALSSQLITAALLAFLLLIPPRTRKIIQESGAAWRRSWPILAAEESFTFLAMSLESYAIFLAPVGLVKGVTTLTPFYILILAILFKKRHPQWFIDQTDGAALVKKIVLFSLTVVGILLIGL